MIRLLRKLMLVSFVPFVCGSLYAQTYTAKVYNHTVLNLSIPLTGVIEHVSVGAGMKVNAGQELLRLDCRVYQEEFLQESAHAAAMVLTKKNAQQKLDRTADMYSQDLVTDLVMQTVEDDYAKVKAEFEEAMAAQRIADLKRGYCVLNAVADGTVLSVSTNAGDVITGEHHSRSLLQLLIPSPPWIAFIKKSEGAPLVIGQPVTVKSQGKNVLGKVNNIEFMGEHQQVTITLEKESELTFEDSVTVEY